MTDAESVELRLRERVDLLVRDNSDLHASLRLARDHNGRLRREAVRLADEVARLAGEIDEVSRRVAAGEWVHRDNMRVVDEAAGCGRASSTGESPRHGRLMEAFRVHHAERACLDRGEAPPLRVVGGMDAETIRLIDMGD